MSVHMKKLLTKKKREVICMFHGGLLYRFPRNVAEKYCVANKAVASDEVFSRINKKHTKPGALLKGIRVRESLTQVEMAKKIEVTQSDISQMEKGIRKIGRKIARRIEKLFGVEYRSFLE